MRTSYRLDRREGELLTSKGQVMIVRQDDHNRANDEASLSPRAAPANHLASPWGLVLSLFRRLRPTRRRVTARLSQTCPSLSGSFLRTWSTWRSPRAGIAFRTKGSTSRKASNLCFCLIRLVDRLSTGSLPLALFVFIAESMRIGRRGTSSRECG